MIEHPFWYVAFTLFVVAMLALDLLVLHKKDQEVGLKEALGWSAFWIALALVFNVGVYFLYDHSKAIEFFTAYVLEESLSVDNLFVFIMVFGFFKVKPKYQHKVLFWGILGALVMRAVFIFAGVAIIRQFSWMMYVFGAFLIYTGLKMLFSRDDEHKDFDPNKNKVIQLFKRIFPVINETDSHNFFVRKDKVLYATPLFVCLLFIELSDLIFAVDSIPVVLAVSKDPFIIYTSNIFAILGLRTLYFALSGVMKYFVYLKYALSVILTFIGIKMCINEWMNHIGSDFHISNIFSLSVIVSLLTISILASVWIKKEKKS